MTLRAPFYDNRSKHVRWQNRNGYDPTLT